VTKRGVILYWGLCFVVGYLYLYEASYCGIRISTREPEEAFDFRPIPHIVFISARAIEKALEILSYPSVALSEVVFEGTDFCFQYTVYHPFFIAIQWFIYGCLFGRWRQVKSITSPKIG
jgi:hypothetical protein